VSVSSNVDNDCCARRADVSRIPVVMRVELLARVAETVVDETVDFHGAPASRDVISLHANTAT